jgi:tRNA(Ile)-lysidine synthase TilS/MesJ
MRCSKCRNEAILFQPYSGQSLCRDHFIADFETKAKRAIRVHRWMRPNDHIAVALKGDPADEALLVFFRKLARNRRDIRVSGIPNAGEISDILRIPPESGITRIALATPLEDRAASILTDILRGDVGKCFPPGTAAGDTLPIITPFCHIPAEEIACYARIHGLEGKGTSCPPDNDPLTRDVKALLDGYSRRHPAAPYAVLNLGEELERAGISGSAGRDDGA